MFADVTGNLLRQRLLWKPPYPSRQCSEFSGMLSQDNGPAQRKSSNVKEHYLSISKPRSKDGKFQGKAFLMRYCSIRLASFWLGQVMDVPNHFVGKTLALPSVTCSWVSSANNCTLINFRTGAIQASETGHPNAKSEVKNSDITAWQTFKMSKAPNYIAYNLSLKKRQKAHKAIIEKNQALCFCNSCR